VADRRGDVLLAQGKGRGPHAFQAAWAAMDEKLDYRRLVEAKLVSLGVAPPLPRPVPSVGGRPMSRWLTRRAAGAALAVAAAGCLFVRPSQTDAAGELHAAHRGPPGLVGQRGRHRLPAERGGAQRPVHCAGNNGTVVALNAETGAELWRARPAHP
jgi:hypothetical protein